MKIKVEMEYPLNLKFKAFLSHSCITRLLNTEASIFFSPSAGEDDRAELQVKAKEAFRHLHEAKRPTLLVSYQHGTFLISAVSFKTGGGL